MPASVARAWSNWRRSDLRLQDQRVVPRGGFQRVAEALLAHLRLVERPHVQYVDGGHGRCCESQQTGEVKGAQERFR